jgi:hypothetical protein
MTEIVRIPFHGGEVLAADVDGKPHIVLKPAFESIGLDADRQIAKLKNQAWATTAVTAVVAADGKERSMVTADVRTFLMALATIPAARVAEAVRPKLIAYQSEVADVIAAYWTKGGSINPRAGEDQLEVLITRAHGQARVLQTINGLVDAKWLEGKARALAARALGEELELPEHLMPLYVPDFLKGKGLDSGEITSVQSWFGRRVVEMGEANGLDLPELRPRTLPNGTMRETRAWTREYLPLFEQVWETHYAERYARPMFMVGGGR